MLIVSFLLGILIRKNKNANDTLIFPSPLQVLNKMYRKNYMEFKTRNLEGNKRRLK